MRDLVDFEVMAGREGAGEFSDTESVVRAVAGRSGAVARRAGLLAWLEGMRADGKETAGEVWQGARGLAAAVVALVMFLTGIGVMTGMLDRARMAFHVPMVLGVTVGLPLLVLLVGMIGWLARGRFAAGLGVMEKGLGWLVGRLGGGGKAGWWRILKMEGGRGWEALGWNLMRLAQVGAVMFSLGTMAGLLGCIWFLEVGFFWESTTPEWMAARLGEVCGVLSAPWGWAWPGGVPDMKGIEGTRWMKGGSAGRMESAATWYRFLFAAIFCWGVLPRMGLWTLAFFKERGALDGLDFQAQRHRRLWRELMGTRRMEEAAGPLDGVLVLDVGGTGLREEDLRGFLLRRLRVNPGEWHEVGVWDGKGEAAAGESILRAPAGVVLLAEGWALSPPRMRALHGQIRGLAGGEPMIYFLVVNVGGDGMPGEPESGEKEIWKDFVDGLADAAAEVRFYEEESA